MATRTRFGNAGALGALAVFVCTAAAPAAEIQWRADYNAARREAMAKNLPILMEFGTHHCPWCVKMDKATYHDGDVVAYVNQHFVAVKVDGDRDVLLTRGLAVECFPTAVLASPDGKLVDRIEGYLPARAFADHLRKAVAAAAEWPARAWADANKAMSAADYPKAIGCLKRLSTTAAAGAYQAKATELLAQLEGQATEQARQAVQLHEQGREGEARQGLGAVARTYVGTQAAANAQQVLSTWASQDVPVQASFTAPK